VSYLVVKWLHVLSSTVLLGTGAGIAYFFVRARALGDVRVIAAVSRDVVRADFLFTAIAVVVQPLTGFWLMQRLGYPVGLPWIRSSLVVFVLVGACWLPVMWLQMRMRDLAVAAHESGTPLPEQFHRYYRWWFALGWPGFAGVLLIFWMMVAKWGW
jgi:uncharacterized membrane protein